MREEINKRFDCEFSHSDYCPIGHSGYEDEACTCFFQEAKDFIHQEIENVLREVKNHFVTLWTENRECYCPKPHTCLTCVEIELFDEGFKDKTKEIGYNIE